MSHAVSVAFAAQTLVFRRSPGARSPAVRGFFCWNPVEIWYILFRISKCDSIHFLSANTVISAFDTVQGRSFYFPVRWFIFIADFYNTLLQIHMEKRTSVFYVDGPDYKIKYIRRLYMKKSLTIIILLHEMDFRSKKLYLPR